MSYLADFVQSIKSRGVLGTVRWVTAGFLRVNHFLVFHLDLRQPFTLGAVDPRLELRAGTIEELVRLRTGREGLPVEFYCDQTHGFTMPFFAFWEGELAAIHWLVFPGQRSRFLSMQPGDVELNFIVVLPEFRGHRIAQALMSYMTAWAKNAGYRRLFCVVHGTNIGQFKPMLDMGFRPVEVVSHFAHRRPKATLRYVRP